MSQTTTSTTTDASIDRSVPKSNETVSKRVLTTNDDTGRRRVERTYTRVIRSPDGIVNVEVGDTLVRDAGRGKTDEWTITALGSDVSSSEGIHVATDSGTPMHLRLIYRGLEKGNIVIHGERTETFTEVKGQDY